MAHTTVQRRDTGAKVYQHKVSGFKLLIPAHIAHRLHNSTKVPGGCAFRCDTHLFIGSVRQDLHHKTQTLHGDVPASWLIDLNAGTSP